MDAPRRNYLDKLSPAEMAIHNAIKEVEKCGASPELTSVVSTLLEAKNKMSDYVDGKLNHSLVEGIAKVCHEANMAWCQANGDNTQKHWPEAEQWQRDSAIAGVEFILSNPGAKEDAMHDNWVSEKLKDGWTYGETKDAEKKTHPCIVPFENLPEFQQKKDALFCAIVNALR